MRSYIISGISLLIFSTSLSAKSIPIRVSVRGESVRVIDTGRYSEKTISPTEREKLFNEAKSKAKLYCIQALGDDTHTKELNRKIERKVTAKDQYTLTFVSNLSCSRNLNLEHNDRVIGKYLDHARWVLSNFSQGSYCSGDHGLIDSTQRILAQIGAPAVMPLWNALLDCYPPSFDESEQGNFEKSNLFQALEYIAENNNSSSVLDEFINILTTPEGAIMRRAKTTLFRRGNWSTVEVPVRLFKAIEEYVSRIRVAPNDGTLWDESALIALLSAYSVWLSIQTSENEMPADTVEQLKSEMATLLEKLPDSAINPPESGTTSPDVFARELKEYVDWFKGV